MRLFFTLFFCLCLAACGAIKLTYNNSDTLLYWWLDGYVDVTLDQKIRVKDDLLALQQWHRKTQLPMLITMTQTLQKQIVSDVTPALLCTNADTAASLISPLTTFLEPSVLWLVTNLSPDQIQSMSEKFEKTNKDWRKDWMPAKRSDLLQKSEKSLRDRLDPLYGKLTESQLKMLRDAINDSPFDAKLAYAERLRRQQDLLATLKLIQGRKLTESSAKPIMQQLLERTAESPDAAFRTYFQKVKLHNCNLFSILHNTMSAQQKSYALDKLKEYEQDFRTLQANR